MDQKQLYEKFQKESLYRHNLGSVLGHLGWDQQVMLPAGAHPQRQEQMVALSTMVHKLGVCREWGELVHQLYDIGEDKFDEYEWKNISESKRSIDESTKIPQELIEESARLAAQGHALWVEAKKKNDFSLFSGTLEKHLILRKKVAEILYPDKHPYDVCLDGFERGMNREYIDGVFAELKAGLVKLLDRIEKSPKDVKPFPDGPYPVGLQRELNREISERIGFDFECGRIDESAHPFSGGGHFTDVRITTRYEDGCFFNSLSSTVHETGHGMYEQGRMRGMHQDMPVSASLGLVVHESQALLWERMVSQGQPFWKHFGPEIVSTFPEKLSDFDPMDLYRACNRVVFQYIRINADEVTYPLHIILRYELEKELFEGSLKVEELPEAWNAKSHELLGFIPSTDSIGVLQDAHWSDGGFGYFPVYTLGAMYGAQLFHHAMRVIPGLESHCSNGDFSLLKKYLNENIHQKGRLYEARELLKKVTGEDLCAKKYLDYLDRKYSEIYGI